MLGAHPEDTWSEPVNMGEKINTPEGGEWSPYVSPDGKYFFFVAGGDADPHGADIYWVDTKIFERLRTKTSN